jgi:hypothetical protein
LRCCNFLDPEFSSNHPWPNCFSPVKNVCST